jgi:hypothetical protein
MQRFEVAAPITIMNIFKEKFNADASALMVCALIASPLANACCPDGGGGAPKTASGLGESFPVALDMVPDPAWQVYEFERDGVRYIQINDQSGTVRAAAGRIGGTSWVLPIGRDADRVKINGQPVPNIHGRTLYHSNDVEVVLYRSINGDHWMIRTMNVSQ